MDIKVILSKIKQFPIAVGAGVLAILLLVGYYFRGGAIPEMETSLESLEREVRLIRSNVDQSVGIEDDLEAMVALVELVDARLMTRQERAINVQYFYNFDLEEGLVDIVSVNQLPPTTTGPRGANPQDALGNYDLITFSAQAEGTFEEILQLFYRLRNGEIIMRVENFSLRPKGTAGPEADILVADLRINALGKKPE